MKKHWRPKRKADGWGRSNASRAETAAEATLVAAKVRGDLHDQDLGPDEEHIADLLADLGHLCDREGLPFEKVIATAKTNWEAER